MERGYFKEMINLSSSRENFIKKKKEALIKINSLREEFRKKENEMKAGLEEADKIWAKLSKKFKWWQTLP